MRPCESDPPVSLHVAQRHSVLILASESRTPSSPPTCMPLLDPRTPVSSLSKVLGPCRYLGGSHFRVFHDGSLPPSPKPGTAQCPGKYALSESVEWIDRTLVDSLKKWAESVLSAPFSS